MTPLPILGWWPPLPILGWWPPYPYLVDDPPTHTWLMTPLPILGWWPPYPYLPDDPPPQWLDDVLSQVGFSSVCVKAGPHETCAAGTSFHLNLCRKRKRAGHLSQDLVIVITKIRPWHSMNGTDILSYMPQEKCACITLLPNLCNKKKLYVGITEVTVSRRIFVT